MAEGLAGSRILLVQTDRLSQQFPKTCRGLAAVLDDLVACSRLLVRQCHDVIVARPLFRVAPQFCWLVDHLIAASVARANPQCRRRWYLLKPNFLARLEPILVFP